MFPHIAILIFIVHKLRNSCSYLFFKDLKRVHSDFKITYKAINKETASFALHNIEKN